MLKMLGAKPMTIFWPICASQLTRIAVASVLSVVAAVFIVSEFEKVFAWNWPGLGIGTTLGFGFGSVLAAAGLLYLMFISRFKKVSLG